jgi:hypothetical protein
MRLLVVALAILGVAAVACGGGGDSGGGGSLGGGGGSSGNDTASNGGGNAAAREGGNHCVFVDELASFDGDEVLLCAEVASAEYFPDQKRNTIIYFGAPPPGEIARVLLEGATRSAFLTPPEERFGEAGTLICAQGEVSIVDGVPQVFVNNMQEIVFLEELVVTGNSCTGAGTN